MNEIVFYCIYIQCKNAVNHTVISVCDVKRRQPYSVSDSRHKPYSLYSVLVVTRHCTFCRPPLLLLVYSLCPSLVYIVSLKSTAEKMLTLKFEVGPLAGFMAAFVLALCALFGMGTLGRGLCTIS